MAIKLGKRIRNKSVFDSIPFTGILGDGTIEIKPGLYSKAYHLGDVNFTISNRETEIEIFDKYKDMLNSFDSPFQIVIHNYKSDLTTVMKNVRLSPARDGLNEFRQEINGQTLEKLHKGTGALKQDKYLIVTREAENAEEALKKFKTTDNSVDKHLRNLTKENNIKPVGMVERLETLYRIYNQNDDNFYNDVDSNGNKTLNLESMSKRGYSVKNLIAPNGMMFEKNTFMIGDTYGRALYLDRIPSFVKTDFMAELANINAEMLISLHFMPVDRDDSREMITNHLRNINAEISRKQEKAALDGISADLINPELEASKRATLTLMEDIDTRGQHIFFFSLCVVVFSNSSTELMEALDKIASVSKNHDLPLKPMTFLQEDGLNSALPLGVNALKKKSLFTSEDCSIFIPYTSQELHQKNGICYGINKTTKNLIMFDRLNERNQNFNALYIAGSGGGKSFAAKNEMIQVYLKSEKNVVYVIDPEGEYVRIARNLNGEVIELSPQSRSFINPFDMDLEYGGEDSAIGVKAGYITGMIELMLGTGGAVDGKSRSIIDRCVKNVYKGYFEHLNNLRNINPSITCDRDASPTLQKLYSEFREQPEPEAQELASIIETFAVGTSDIFAHRTNVSTDKRLVVYDINKLGRGLWGLGLYIVLNDIWNKMIENHKKGLNTWIYIDEFKLLLQLESSAMFVTQFWLRARKWHGVPTAILQNTDDLLMNTTIKGIINNTYFLVLMSMQKQQATNMMEFINLEESQLQYLEPGQDKGEGLIYTGNVVIPFSNEYPKEGKLFKLFDTTNTKKFM